MPRSRPHNKSKILDKFLLHQVYEKYKSRSNTQMFFKRKIWRHNDPTTISYLPYFTFTAWNFWSFNENHILESTGNISVFAFIAEVGQKEKWHFL